MKNLNLFISAVSLCLYLTISLFTGCGDNSVNNNNQTGQTLIFSIDSIGIYGTGLQGLAYSDTITHSPVSQNLKINFSVETNCDSADNPFLTVVVYDTSSIYLNDTIPSINSSYTLNCTIGNSFKIALFDLIFNTQQSRYLRFKNIKFYN